MGILSNILESLAIGIAKVAIAGGGALARIAARVAAEAKPRIIAAITAARDEWNRRRELQQRDTDFISKTDITEEIREINDRLARLAKSLQSRELTSKENGLRRELDQRRTSLKAVLQSEDELRIAESIADNQDEYTAVSISNDNSHLLQSTVGQTIYGKLCPDCGWQMQLQWNRDKSSVTTNDFGWGCTGWYWRGPGNRPHRCEHWEALAPEDFDIFGRANRAEYTELKPLTFAKMVLDHSPQVIKRIEAVRNDRDTRSSIEAYRCPVHGESLVLRQKQQHEGRLLNMYFLGCSRWNPEGHGCQFIVKLKSPAQLNAYLEAATGEGII